MSLRHLIGDIRDSLKQLDASSKSSLTDFKSQRAEGAKLLLSGAVQRLLMETKDSPAHSIAQKISQAKHSDIPLLLDKLAEYAADEKTEVSYKLPVMPADIRDEIGADMRELDMCMKNGCYRSAVILCGRIMETALHRKYYDATGNDLLEKAPGMGLGNLIARLSEKGVPLDPGLPNQIHIVNQLRIFSVHKKQVPFSPSKNQAEAIVLYTMDILEKLFK